MVMAEEMQQAVDHEVGDLARVGASRGAGLRPSRFDGNVDLPEEDRTRRVFERFGVGEGKGEDVGRLVDLAKIAVQNTNGRVAGQNDRGGRARAAETEEGVPDQRLKSGQS